MPVCLFYVLFRPKNLLKYIKCHFLTSYIYSWVLKASLAFFLLNILGNPAKKKKTLCVRYYWRRRQGGAFSKYMAREGAGSEDLKKSWLTRTVEECVSVGHPECRLRAGEDRELMNIVR